MILVWLTNWYGLCNLVTYVCYTYRWHLVHVVVLVILGNVVQSISIHLIYTLNIGIVNLILHKGVEVLMLQWGCHDGLNGVCASYCMRFSFRGV